MTPPFKYYIHQETNSFCILDDGMNLMAANIENEEFARLTVGLLNGHFNVPILFESEKLSFLMSSSG
jgi:hypothetical protein